MRESAGRAAAWARRWVAAAPGTHVWLLLLAVTALQLQQLPPRARRVVLRADSTNLHQLAHHPLHVLLLSALWTQASLLLVDAVLFTLILAPVERWLGTGRWLAVVVLAHVGATLVAEAVVRLAIWTGVDEDRMRYTLDIGVSYGLAGAAGVLAYRFRPPWREAYLVLAVLYLGGRLALFHTFTDLGHLVAFAIGLCCLPLTRGPAARATRRGRFTARLAAGPRPRTSPGSGPRRDPPG